MKVGNLLGICLRADGVNLPDKVVNQGLELGTHVFQNGKGRIEALDRLLHHETVIFVQLQQGEPRLGRQGHGQDAVDQLRCSATVLRLIATGEVQSGEDVLSGLIRSAVLLRCPKSGGVSTAAAGGWGQQKECGRIHACHMVGESLQIGKQAGQGPRGNGDTTVQLLLQRIQRCGGFRQLAGFQHNQPLTGGQIPGVNHPDVFKSSAAMQAWRYVEEKSELMQICTTPSYSSAYFVKCS